MAGTLWFAWLDDPNSTVHQLQPLIANITQSEDGDLPSIAMLYLDFFCNPASSPPKRRWVGVALHKMIAASAAVVNKLKTVPKATARIGGIILATDELDETRLLAGIILRQALLKEIAYLNLWPSAKVPNSLPQTLYPMSDGRQWMHEFHAFRSELRRLRLTRGAPHASAHYPFALSASDGYQWRSDLPVEPVALVQGSGLTCVVPDMDMLEFTFIDVPLPGIDQIVVKRSLLYDSQAQGTDHEPWDTHLSLGSGSSLYQVDASERSAATFTALFVDAARATRFCESMNHQLDPSTKGNASEVHISGSPRYEFSQSSLKGGRLPQHSKIAVPTNHLTPVANSHTECISAGSILATARSNSTPLQAGTDTEGPAGSEERLHEQQPIPANHQRNGALPSISKSGRKLVASATKNVLGNANELEFPDSSSRMKRPAKQQTKLSNASKSVLSAKKSQSQREDGRKSIKTPIRRAPRQRESQREDVHDTEDEEDPFPSQPVDHSTETAPALGPQPQLLSERPGHLAKPTQMSKLKRSAKQRTPSGAIANSGDKNDVFAIPVHEDKACRKARAKVVSYEESDYTESEEEDKSSDYEDPALKRDVRKPRGPLRERHVNGASKLSQSRPRSRRSGQKPRRKQGKSSPAAGSIDAMFLSARRTSKAQPSAPDPSPSSARLRSERNILDLLNDEENANSGGLITGSDARDKESSSSPARFSAKKETATNLCELSQKRAAPSPPPGTPTVKRRKLSRGSIANSPKNGTPAPRATIARVRTMEEPGSPCTEIKHALYGRNEFLAGTPTGSAATPGVTLSLETDFPYLDIEQPASFGKLPPQALLHRRTPSCRFGQATPGANANGLELLSSNSKPLPDSPRALSRAISGHASSNEMIENRTQRLAKDDPFKNSPCARRQSMFTRRLTDDHEGEDRLIKMCAATPSKQMARSRLSQPHICESPRVIASSHPQNHSAADAITKKQESKLALANADASEKGRAVHKAPAETNQSERRIVLPDELMDFDTNGDDTLVGQSDDELEPARHELPSSPPMRRQSLSSHSSTSAGPTTSQHQGSTPPSQFGEDLEWEQSFEPHQRPIAEQLMRISKRVTKHIVDNETAIDDIVDMYDADTKSLLDKLTDDYDNLVEPLFNAIEGKKVTMKDRLAQLAMKLHEQRKASGQKDAQRVGDVSQAART